MGITNEFAQITSLIAESTRATMLWSLLDGRAYTAGELAIAANVSPQSASSHLGKLTAHNLIKIEKQGRHRYYKLASPKVAYVIESIANLIPEQARTTNNSVAPKKGIRYARTCYDHLAGKLGVSITQAMLENELLRVEAKKYELSLKGLAWFENMGIDIQQLRKSKRSFAHQCLDWSERKHHIAGALGAALLTTMLERDWVRRKNNSREIIVTHLGQEKILEYLKINI